MEKISVSIRVRPLNKVEVAKGTPWTVDANSLHLCSEKGLPIPGQAYTFDHVFNAGIPTQDIYRAVTDDIIQSTVNGFNGTVFAYGQTSSGKTHTMRGTPQEPGIIPLAIQHVFQKIEETLDREFLLRVSYLEIYNEEINDLLNPENRKLPIHENLERGVFVAGLAEAIVMSPEHVLELMTNGEAHRHIGETNMNQASSRSHTIFRMVIESREKLFDDEEHNCDAVRVSSLTLVDLAGSERVAKTGAEGTRMKEGTHINKSLMTLGTVINKLADGAEKIGGHIPYRDSKLTRILQPALGGNAKTAIICNVTPSLIHVEETRGTLQFAGRAKRITNCAQVNEIVTEAALLKRQQREIEELRRKLQGDNSEIMEAEIAKMRNAMLAIEVEKERLALELEERRAEEQRRKAETEVRMREQQQKIDSLSHMVINSAVDDTQEKKTRRGNRRATWVPRIQPSVVTDLAADRPPFREVPQGLFGSGLPPPSRMSRVRDLPPAFDRLVEEPPVVITGRPFRISEDSSVSDCWEQSPRVSTSERRSGFTSTESIQLSVESVDAQSTVEQQLANLQQRYKELEERTLQEAQEKILLGGAERLGVAEVGQVHEGDAPPLSAVDRRGRSLGGADGHASVKALKGQLKQLQLEKVFMQRELDALTQESLMRASLDKDELDAVYAELNDARRALADPPTGHVCSEAPLQNLALQSRLAEALREKEAALAAAERADERAAESTRAQMVGLEERLAQALRDVEAAERQQKAAKVQAEGVEGSLAEAARAVEELAACERRCAALEADLEAERKAREAAEERFCELKAEAGANEATILELREQLEAALTGMRRWESENLDSGEVVDQDGPVQVADHRKKPTLTEAKLSALQADLSEARAKIGCLERELEEAVRVGEEDDVRRAEQHAAGSRGEEQGRQAQEVAGKMGHQMEVVESGKVEADKTVKALAADLSETELAVKGAERASKASAEHPQTLREEPGALEDRVKESEAALLVLEKVREELAAARAEVVASRKAADSEREVSEERKGLLRTIAAMEGERQKMEQQVQSLGEEREELLRLVGVATKETEALTAERVRLEATLEGLQTEIRKSNHGAAGLKVDSQQLEEKLSAVSGEKLAAKAQVAELLDERVGLKDAIEGAQGSKERLEEKIKEVEGQLQIHTSENASLMESKLRLESNVSILEARIVVLETSCSDTRCALEAAADECARVTASLVEVRGSLQSTQMLLATVEAAKAEAEAAWVKALHEVEQVKGEKSSALRRTGELEAQLETQRSVASEALKELEATKQGQHKEVAGLRVELGGLRKDLAHARAEPATLCKQRDSLQKELEKLRGKMRETEARLKTAVQDKNQLQAEKSAQERDLKRLRGQASTVEHLASKRESLIVKSRESIAVGLKSTKSELSLVQAALQNKAVELEKTAFELQMMQSSQKSLEGSVTDLEASRECLTHRIAEVEACLIGVTGERDQMAADASAQATELILAHQEAEKVAQELATLAGEHSALVEQLRAAEEGARKGKEDAGELEQVKAELVQVMEQMTESHFQFEEDKAAWEAKYAQAAKERAEWEQQVASLTALRSELEGKAAALDEVLAQLKRQADEAAAVKASLIEEVAALQQTTAEERKEYMGRKDAEVRRLSDEVAALKLQCEEVEHQLEGAEKGLEDSHRATAALEAATDEREARLEAMLQQSMTQIAEARQEVADIEDKMSQLQAGSLKLEVALDGATGKVQLMEDRAAAAEAHAEKMREQLVRTKASAAHRETEIEKASATEKDAAERRWQETMDAAQSAWQCEMAEQAARVGQLEHDLEVAKGETEALGAKLQDLRAQLEVEEERRRAAERDTEALASIQGMREQEVQRLQVECQALKQEAQGASARGTSFEQAAEIEGRLLEVTEQNRLLQSKLRKAEGMLERAKSWKEEVRRQRDGDQAQAKAEATRLQADLERREAERMHLATELAAANAQNAKGLSSHVVGLIHPEKEASTEDLTKARQMLVERRDYKERCRRLEGTLRDLRSMFARHGGRTADFDKHVTLKELEYRVAAEKATADALKVQAAKLEEQLMKANAETGQLRGKLQEVTFKHCALLRTESLHQLHAASPSKAARADGIVTRPPLAEKNKLLPSEKSPSKGSIKKSALSGHSVVRANLSSTPNQSVRRDKENKATF